MGKSALALELAQGLGGEIVNADSRQVYRYMEIGTGKPTPEEQSRVPHHLFDIIDPDEEFSLARYLDLAHGAIQDILRRGKLPLVVGGTGQYIWALVEGWRVPGVPPQPQLRRELEERARHNGVAQLYQELQRVDPEAAARILPNNLRRIVRALEVYYTTGVPFSRLASRGETPYRWLILGITMPREELYRRIDQRAELTLARGWLEEVRGLLARGYSPDLPSMSSLGYRELVQHLQGELSLEEALQRIKYQTHRLARSQYTWFRLNDPRIHWLENDENLVRKAYQLARAFLQDKC